MEQLPIVRRHVRIWPILLTLLVIAMLVAAAFYVIGDGTVTDVGRLSIGNVVTGEAIT